MATATIYYDLEKFYDNICLFRLCQFALQLQYPPVLLALRMQGYLGRRLLRADGCVSQFILPTNSLGAGCRRANTFARIFSREVLGHATARHYVVRVYQYFGDLVQRCEGAVISILLEGLVALELPVSWNKIKVGGTPAAARAVAVALKARGYTLAVDSDIKDFGVCRTYRGRRGTKAISKRLKFGLGRCTKIKQLKFTGRTRRLFSTGCPQGDLGHRALLNGRLRWQLLFRASG